MATSQEIQARQNRIADLFRDNPGTFWTVEHLLHRLTTGSTPADRSRAVEGKDAAAAVRMLQRDLDALAKQGLVEACVLQDGKHVPAGDHRSSRSPKVAATPLLWGAGPNLTDDIDLENVAAAVALETLCKDLSWLVPQSLTDEFRDARDRARRSIEKMRSASPPRRWLQALKLESTHASFEQPLFDEDVRHVIEQAILQARKVQLSVGDETLICSVSRFVIKLPNRVQLEVLDDDDEVSRLWLGDDSGPWVRRIRLETITKAELSDEKSSRAPAADIGRESAYRSRRAGTAYEFRASPRQMERWTGTWLADRIERLGEDAEGWTICRYADNGDAGSFSQYLYGLGASVEVLKPSSFRASVAEHYRSAARMYGNEQGLPVDIASARADEERVAALGGKFPRLINPEWVPFTEHDTYRLQRSSVWQSEPDAVEMLCRLFCAEDPAGICTPENPKAATEYLTEAEAIVRLLPTIESEAALAKAFETEFHGQFASDDPSDDVLQFEEWAEMAGVAWVELTGYRIRRRQPAAKPS